MLAEERRLKLIEWTRSEGRLDATDAASKLSVAVETVRRDLDILQRRGVVRRVHGGAISLERYTKEYTIPERYDRNPREKQALADLAAAYIPKEGCIFVDGGTTTECLAPHLRDRPNLLVVTNSITLAHKISDTSTKVKILGGQIRPATLSSVGAKTVADLSELNAVASFIGTNGISIQGGVTAFDTDEAMVKKTMMKNSIERFLLADAGKFGSSYPARFANFEDFDRLVTNVTTHEEFIEAFTNAGVEIALS
jgi:DeoR family fructose operon transcriptional repressor